ncbi:MAG: CDP-glycerol glycerophosphotransferase family protein [Bacteroidales bacterium]|nr:CDP-glycerol glycerophosphotransferase family protein [Bacteroidales bacterium]
MADYLSEIFTIFHSDTRLIFYVILPEVEERLGANEYMRKLLPVKVVNHRWAKIKPWDLIIAVDHCWQDILDCKWNPVIFIGHGIESGKLVEGERYGFGSRALTADGSRSRYSRMCAVSYLEQKLAAKQTSVLNDTIVVTGSLKADKVIVMKPQRNEIRYRRGFKSDDTVVLVMSTWGPNCLYQRMGNAIVAQALRLKEEFSFIFTMHPNEHRPVASPERNWGEYMKAFRKDGFVVLDANEEFETSIVASDVILTDHTSAALYGVVLGRPMVYVPYIDECVEEGSLVWRLKNISPVLCDDATDLNEQILEARDRYPLDKLAEIACEITAFPGGAITRTKEEVYGLLNLPIY